MDKKRKLDKDEIDHNQDEGGTSSVPSATAITKLSDNQSLYLYKSVPKQKLPRTDHSCSTANAADDSWEGDQIESDSKAEDENDSYNMSSKNRGVALIFNNENFETEHKRRLGTQKDRDKAVDTLLHLGFAVYPYNDLSKKEILGRLKDASKLDHSQNDCIVTVVLTHGEKDGSLCAKDSPYSRKDLYSPFVGNSCKTLCGKPKIFIIQACWGPEYMEGAEPFSEQTDNDDSSRCTIPAYSDLFIYSASFEGFVSFRNPDRGSYFIQQLMKELRQSAFKLDLISIVLRMQRKMEREIFNTERGQCKQIPLLQMTCGRKIKFTLREVLKQDQYPRELVMSSKKDVFTHIDLSKKTTRQLCDESSIIEEHGVLHLTNVPGAAVDHVKHAASTVQLLELKEANLKQFSFLDMPNLVHLKAMSPLKKTSRKPTKADSGNTEDEERLKSTLKSRREEEELDGGSLDRLDPHLPSLPRLESLEVELGKEALLWLLKGCNKTLKKLHLWVGVSPKKGMVAQWPKSCSSLDQVLQTYSLSVLQTVLLDRRKQGLTHFNAECLTQKNEIENIFETRNVKVLCSTCDRKGFMQYIRPPTRSPN